MNADRWEALAGSYRQLASGLSALLRAYRETWPPPSRGRAGRARIAGALAQLEALGVTAVYLQDEDPQADRPWLADEPRASPVIRWHDVSPGPCFLCGSAVGTGPSGWLAGSGPLCDPCLLGQSYDLGVLLQAANVLRELAAVHADQQGEGSESHLATEAQTSLMTYARLYHRISAERWPYRPVGLLVYLRHLADAFDHIEWGEAADEILVRGPKGKHEP